MTVIARVFFCLTFFTLISMYISPLDAIAEKLTYEVCVENASDSNPECQFVMAKSYFMGQGVEKKPKEGIKWLTRASENGHAVSTFYLSEYYFTGRDNLVEKDPEKGLALLKSLSDQGYPYAQNALGECYAGISKICGVEKNYDIAIKLLKQATEEDHVIAPFNLALLYLEGKGVEKNLEEAKRLLEITAERKGPKQKDAKNLLANWDKISAKSNQ